MSDDQQERQAKRLKKADKEIGHDLSADSSAPSITTGQSLGMASKGADEKLSHSKTTITPRYEPVHPARSGALAATTIMRGCLKSKPPGIHPKHLMLEDCEAKKCKEELVAYAKVHGLVKCHLSLLDKSISEIADINDAERLDEESDLFKEMDRLIEAKSHIRKKSSEILEMVPDWLALFHSKEGAWIPFPSGDMTAKVEKIRHDIANSRQKHPQLNEEQLLQFEAEIAIQFLRFCYRPYGEKKDRKVVQGRSSVIA